MQPMLGTTNRRTFLQSGLTIASVPGLLRAAVISSAKPRIPIGFLGRATDRAQLWTLVEHAMRTALLKQLGDDAVSPLVVPTA